MKKELHAAFNEEITRYKNTLLFYARKCDWDTFKVNAGRLFDYIESIEMSETKRKFLKVFGLILAVLVPSVLFILKIHMGGCPTLLRLRDVLGLTVIAGCGFEFYFFLNFRMYMDVKTALYKKRRERFIKNIEQDFRKMILLSKA